SSTASDRPLPPLTALLFRGCVMDGLFSHVHDATIRTLAVNGYEVRAVAGQVCCGALHAHAGLRDEARVLACQNVAAVGSGDEPIVVNSAGCGAMLKEYAHLLAERDGAGGGGAGGGGGGLAAGVGEGGGVAAGRGPRAGRG